HTEETAREEVERITKELKKLSHDADFPLEIKPVERAASDEEAVKIRDRENIDVMLLYAAGAGYLDACISGKRYNIIFVRHRSGPVYDWYENAHNRFLRVGGNNFEYDKFRNYGGTDYNDIVVDDYDDILYRLRALYGVKNFLGKRIVALGGGQGKGCPQAPNVAKEKFNINIIDVKYEDLEKRIKSARMNRKLVKKCEEWTERYLSLPHTRLNTKKEFIKNCFILYTIYKEYMHENDAEAFTINRCMRTIIPVSETTACLTLSLLNDEGYLAFCESDFAVIPSGILLHYVSGKPVFLNNPTFPHKGMVTCAHCTAPRRMDGKNYDPAEIVTHYESDYGAAPKVEMPLGKEITLINPDCSQNRWLGFKGTVDKNPFYSICRSQQDILIQGDWKKLIREIKGSHWMIVYDDYLREMEYAVHKIGLEWLNISET
ncbi:sugar isomerase, partial [candidate division KSB1 bacterium]